MKMHLAVSVLVLFLCVSFADAKSWTWFLNENKTMSWDVNLDPYYSSIGAGLSIQEEPVVLDIKSEEGVYTYLFKNFIFPHDVRPELSINPFPVLGAYLRGQQKNFYASAELSEGFNLVKAITEGFPDAGAFSLFLGNKAYTGDYETGEIKGLGYGGGLLNYGNYHIVNNRFVRDHWFEAEAKMKGSSLGTKTQYAYSYRAGGKLHTNKSIENTIFLSFKRDRTDRNYTGWSIFKNSDQEFRVDLVAWNLALTRYQLILGKKVPFGKDGKYVFSLSVGVLGILGQGYRGDLRQEVEDAPFTVVVRPNILF